MKKLIAGSFQINNEEVYYTDDFTTFYDRNDVELSIDTLKAWAVCLNSPWLIAHEKYIVELNYNDAYTEIPKNVPLYRCIYVVIGYDGIETEIFGYGKDAEEALTDCIVNFNKVQMKYNPNDESI